MVIKTIREFLLLCILCSGGASCTRYAFPAGQVLEDREGKLLYSNDSLDFSVSYWAAGSKYVVSPSRKAQRAFIPPAYRKTLRKYDKRRPLVIYRHWSTSPPRRFLVCPPCPDKPSLDESRNDLYNYLRKTKQIINIDTSTTDTAFHYDHREIRYYLKTKSQTFLHVLEYHTLVKGAVCRFVFMMERKKEADYLEAGLFFDLDVSLAMDTFHLY